MTSSQPSDGAGTELEHYFREGLALASPRRLTAAACAQLTEPRYCVLALGKAAGTMAEGAYDALGDRISGGLVVTNAAVDDGRLPILVSSHPRPDHRSEEAGRRLLELAGSARDPVLFLISGGGSSLAAVPADGLAIADKSKAVDMLSRSGAEIHELNALRASLSAIKGGKLALACTQPSTTLVVSDVVGDDPAFIASGPTVPSNREPGEVIAICRRYRIWDELPDPIRAHLEGTTRSLADAVESGPPVTVRVIAPMSTVAATVASLARERGCDVIEPERAFAGEVVAVSERLCQAFDGLRAGQLYAGFGESTIELPTDEVGRGGRAHHMAMLLARSLAGQPVCALVAGTDGIDGNSPSAGAIIDGGTWQGLARAGVNGDSALEHFDSYTALHEVGATLEVGTTGVNHADLVLIQRTSD